MGSGEVLYSTAWITMEDEDDTRSRLERAGMALSNDEWDALPQPARRRLGIHPSETASERARLSVLVAWLLREFPPGWSRTDD